MRIPADIIKALEEMDIDEFVKFVDEHMNATEREDLRQELPAQITEWERRQWRGRLAQFARTHPRQP